MSLSDPLKPSCCPFLSLLSRSKIIISLIFLLLFKNCDAFEFSFARILTGVLNFFAIASINGKKITISPIPFLFWIVKIFINAL